MNVAAEWRRRMSLLSVLDAAGKESRCSDGGSQGAGWVSLEWKGKNTC